MSYTQNYGLLLVIDYIMAHNICRYQSGTLTLGTTHMISMEFGEYRPKVIVRIHGKLGNYLGFTLQQWVQH